MKTPKTYALGVDSDRVLVVSKIDGQLLVTIKIKDSDVKHAEFTPKRFVFYLFHIFLLPYVSSTLSLHTVLFNVHLPAQLSSFVSMLQMGVPASDPGHDKRERWGRATRCRSNSISAPHWRHVPRMRHFRLQLRGHSQVLSTIRCEERRNQAY